ncbi:hypothetical protein [Actinocorallia populi]|uniref:hypothetical protein n=1 Tax=Actinocorallia populi TaxID=2079200 RepID=UPI000D08CA9C|nr:hypothetical protein [Actinocorallia populi]
MKIRCACGGVIIDNTDFLPGKAYLIADQDWEDAIGPESGETARQRLRDWSRPMWQCQECGSLYIDDREGNVHCFRPASADAPRDLLSSFHGERWKRPLRGSWTASRTSAPPGELWWGGGEDSRFEEFSSWEELERRYHEVFQRLLDEDVLRDALLRRGSRLIHRWPPPSAGTV